MTELIRLMYPTTTLEIPKLQEFGGILHPDTPFCLPADDVDTVIGPMTIPDPLGAHFTRKWHPMRAYLKALADGSHPAFLSVLLRREDLVSDVGFMLFSKEATNRVRKAARAFEKAKTPEDELTPAYLVESVLSLMTWRKSLQIGNSVASALPVSFEAVAFAAVILNESWLEQFCTVGWYVQDWTRRHLCRGKMTVDDVNRAMVLRGGLKGFPFFLWEERKIDEVVVESFDAIMRLSDMDGKRQSEQHGLPYDSVSHFRLLPNFAQETQDGE